MARRKFTREFKVSAVRLMDAQGYSITIDRSFKIGVFVDDALQCPHQTLHCFDVGPHSSAKVLEEIAGVAKRNVAEALLIHAEKRDCLLLG